MSPFVLTTRRHPSHHLFTHFHRNLPLGRIQRNTRRPCLPLCLILSTLHEMPLSHNQRYSTVRQRLSLYQPQLHTGWQCFPLGVILNITEDGNVCLCVIFNITQEGFASFLNYIRQTAVFAPVCRIQHHARRLC